MTAWAFPRSESRPDSRSQNRSESDIEPADAAMPDATSSDLTNPQTLLNVDMLPRVADIPDTPPDPDLPDLTTLERLAPSFF
jgi:hypothetical protein